MLVVASVLGCVIETGVCAWSTPALSEHSCAEAWASVRYVQVLIAETGNLTKPVALHCEMIQGEWPIGRFTLPRNGDPE